MSFIHELFYNFKDGLMKKGILIVISLVTAIVMCIYSYFSGKDNARYEFVAKAQKNGQIFRYKMSSYSETIEKLRHDTIENAYKKSEERKNEIH